MKINIVFGVGLLALGIGFTGCGGGGEHSGQPAPSDRPAAAAHTPAYNEGYEFGNQHLVPHMSGQYDCNVSAGRHNVARRDLDDWIQGCMDGIRDMDAEVTSPASSNAPVSTSSESYQEGLKAGTNGQAEIAAFGGMAYQRACQMTFDIDGGADPSLVKQDYMAGCLYGLNHESAQWTQGRKAKGGN